MSPAGVAALAALATAALAACAGVVLADAGVAPGLASADCEHALRPAVPAKSTQQASASGLIRNGDMTVPLRKWNEGSGRANVAQLPTMADQQVQAMAQDRMRQ